MLTLQELRQASTEDLTRQLFEARKELHRLCAIHAATALTNPMQIRKLRRYIAQMATVQGAKLRAGKGAGATATVNPL